MSKLQDRTSDGVAEKVPEVNTEDMDWLAKSAHQVLLVRVMEGNDQEPALEALVETDPRWGDPELRWTLSDHLNAFSKRALKDHARANGSIDPSLLAVAQVSLGLWNEARISLLRLQSRGAVVNF